MNKRVGMGLKFSVDGFVSGYYIKRVSFCRVDHYVKVKSRSTHTFINKYIFWIPINSN